MDTKQVVHGNRRRDAWRWKWNIAPVCRNSVVTVVLCFPSYVSQLHVGCCGHWKKGEPLKVRKRSKGMFQNSSFIGVYFLKIITVQVCLMKWLIPVLSSAKVKREEKIHVMARHQKKKCRLNQVIECFKKVSVCPLPISNSLHLPSKQANFCQVKKKGDYSKKINKLYPQPTRHLTCEHPLLAGGSTHFTTNSGLADIGKYSSK